MKWLIYLVHVAICKEVEIDTLRNTERILFNLKRINRAELKPKFTEHKKKCSQWLFFDAIFRFVNGLCHPWPCWNLGTLEFSPRDWHARYILSWTCMLVALLHNLYAAFLDVVYLIKLKCKIASKSNLNFKTSLDGLRESAL